MKNINIYISEKLVLNKNNVKDYANFYEDDIKEVIDIINNFFDSPDTKISIDVEHRNSTKKDNKIIEAYKIIINLTFKSHNKSLHERLIEEYVDELWHQFRNIKTHNKEIIVSSTTYDGKSIVFNVAVSK